MKRRRRTAPPVLVTPEAVAAHADVCRQIRDGSYPEPLGQWYNPMLRRYLSDAEVAARNLVERKAAETVLAAAQVAEAAEEESPCAFS